MGKILVTGASGQVGRELKKLSGKGDFLFADRASLDITDMEKVKQFLGKHPVEAVINSAAYTAVDKAESEPEKARRVNGEAMETLAEACRSRNLKLIHLSTDYVFNGKNHRPYREDDPAAPVNVYGQTKWEGEEIIRTINPENAVIIRTSWLYSAQGSNFVRTMLRLGAEKKEIRVVDDQVGSPTYAGDLAAALLKILPKLRHKKVKTYHYTNEGVCTWYDFAEAIMEYKRLPCKVIPVPSSEYPTPAQRPSYSVLSKEAIKKDLDISIPYWRDSLRKCLRVMGF